MIAAVGKKLRCPHCEKVLGLDLEGYYATACPRCKRHIEFYRLRKLDTSRVIE